MKFTVTWFPPAEDRLAELWLAASDKAELSAASDAIEQLLESNPIGVGEKRTKKIRYLHVPPLAVYYEVRLLDRIVLIRGIWRPPA